MTGGGRSQADVVRRIYLLHQQQVLALAARRTEAVAQLSAGQAAFDEAAGRLRRKGVAPSGRAQVSCPAFSDVVVAMAVGCEQVKSLREALMACEAAVEARTGLARHLSERSEYTCVKNWQAEARILISRHDSDILSRDKGRADRARAVFEKHIWLRGALTEAVKSSDIARYRANRLEVIARQPTTCEPFLAVQNSARAQLAEHPLPVFSQDIQSAQEAIAAFQKVEFAFGHLKKQMQEEIRHREKAIQGASTRQKGHLKRSRESWKLFMVSLGSGLWISFLGLIVTAPILSMVVGVLYGVLNLRGGVAQGCGVGCCSGVALVVSFYGIFSLARWGRARRDAGKEKKQALAAQQTSEDAAQELVNLKNYLSELESVPE